MWHTHPLVSQKHSRCMESNCQRQPYFHTGMCNLCLFCFRILLWPFKWGDWEAFTLSSKSTRCLVCVIAFFRHQASLRWWTVDSPSPWRILQSAWLGVCITSERTPEKAARFYPNFMRNNKHFGVKYPPSLRVWRTDPKDPMPPSSGLSRCCRDLEHRGEIQKRLLFPWPICECLCSRCFVSKARSEMEINYLWELYGQSSAAPQV